MPSEEEFEAWRDHPITQWVFAQCRAAAEANRRSWEEMSWVGGNSDWKELAILRTRADAYHALPDTDYAGWADMAEEDR